MVSFHFPTKTTSFHVLDEIQNRVELQCLGWFYNNFYSKQHICWWKASIFLANVFQRSWSKGRIPGLTSQRHSALISSDSEYFQVCFSAVHYLKISEQRWFSSEQRWKRKFSELKISADTALFQRWFSLKQRWFRAEQRWFPLNQRWFLNNSEWQSLVNSSLFSKVF